MTEHNLLIEFFQVGIYFFSFFVLISIFGFTFLYYFYLRKFGKDQSQKIKVKHTLVSFGIGLCVYISLGYLLAYFNLFNLITGYLGILIYDLFWVLFFILKNKEGLKVEYLLRKLKNLYFTLRENISSILILLLVFWLSFWLFWVLLSESIGLMKRDPYLWIKNIYLLIENQTLDLENLGFEYPSGFVFISTGFMLIFPDQVQIFFFLKIAPIYYFWLYIIISYLILKQIFKKNYLILVSLILLLISNHFLSRYVINVSSSLASLLILISFLIIVNDYPDFLIGFFITGIYLINPLSCFYYLFSIFFYLIYNLLSNIRNRDKFLKRLRSLIFLIFTAVVLLLPYILTYPNDTLNISNWFSKMVANPRFHHIMSLDLLSGIRLLFLLDLDLFKLNIFTKIIFNWWLNNLAKQTIMEFILLSIAGIFIRSKNKKNHLLIFKVSFSSILFFTLLPYFININFFKFFRYRTLEAFSLSVVILAALTLDWIVIKSQKLIHFIQKKDFNSKLRIKVLGKYRKKLTFTRILIFLLILGSFAIFINRDTPEYYYHYDEDYVEMVLYLRRNASNESIIYHPDYGRDDIENVLFDMENHFYNLSYIFIHYKGDYILRLSKFDYFIANISALPEEWRYFKYVNPVPIHNNSNFIIYQNVV